MKNKMILTIVLLLSYAITGLYAAAPGGTGDAEAGNSSESARTTRNVAPGMQRSGVFGSALGYAARAARGTGGTLVDWYSGTRRWLTGGRPLAGQQTVVDVNQPSTAPSSAGVAPTGGDTSVTGLSKEVMHNLEDKWLLHSLMPDILAQQLTRDWIRAGRNSRPSLEEVAQHCSSQVYHMILKNPV